MCRPAIFSALRQDTMSFACEAVLAEVGSFIMSIIWSCSVDGEEQTEILQTDALPADNLVELTGLRFTFQPHRLGKGEGSAP